jgi:ammonia channel protein AmtB
LDVLVFSKPSVIGAVQGMITGLVVITPAAGRYTRTTSSVASLLIQISRVGGAS